MKRKTVTLLTLITLGIVVLCVGVYSLNLLSVRNTLFYYTTGLNGENTDKWSDNQVILSRNYDDAFRKIRSENNILTSSVNFSKNIVESENCPNYISGSNPVDYFNIVTTSKDKSAKINISGYLDSCIKKDKTIAYSSVVGVSSAYNQNYRYSITDFENISVKERLDCIAYELDGKKYINIVARIGSGEPNHFDNEFTSSCELDEMLGGEYQVQYDRVDLDTSLIIVT